MEGAPMPYLTLDPQLTSHQLDQLFGDSQPQPGPATFARHGTIGLHKGFEDRPLSVRGDADAGVTPRKMEQGLPTVPRLMRLIHWLAVDFDHDLPVLGEFAGVAY
jgi:hypothetical protein